MSNININIKTKFHQAKVDFYLELRAEIEPFLTTDPPLNVCLVERLTMKCSRIRQGVKDGAKLDLQWKPESNEDNWKNTQ